MKMYDITIDLNRLGLSNTAISIGHMNFHYQEKASRLQTVSSRTTEVEH